MKMFSELHHLVIILTFRVKWRKNFEFKFKVLRKIDEPKITRRSWETLFFCLIHLFEFSHSGSFLSCQQRLTQVANICVHWWLCQECRRFSQALVCKYFSFFETTIFYQRVVSSWSLQQFSKCPSDSSILREPKRHSSFFYSTLEWDDLRCCSVCFEFEEQPCLVNN